MSLMNIFKLLCVAVLLIVGIFWVLPMLTGFIFKAVMFVVVAGVIAAVFFGGKIKKAIFG